MDTKQKRNIQQDREEGTCVKHDPGRIGRQVQKGRFLFCRVHRTGKGIPYTGGGCSGSLGIILYLPVFQ